MEKGWKDWCSIWVGQLLQVIAYCLFMYDKGEKWSVPRACSCACSRALLIGCQIQPFLVCSWGTTIHSSHLTVMACKHFYWSCKSRFHSQRRRHLLYGSCLHPMNSWVVNLQDIMHLEYRLWSPASVWQLNVWPWWRLFSRSWLLNELTVSFHDWSDGGIEN